MLEAISRAEGIEPEAVCSSMDIQSFLPLVTSWWTLSLLPLPPSGRVYCQKLLSAEETLALRVPTLTVFSCLLAVSSYLVGFPRRSHDHCCFRA